MKKDVSRPGSQRVRAWDLCHTGLQTIHPKPTSPYSSDSAKAVRQPGLDADPRLVVSAPSFLHRVTGAPS